jgi:hypothetical protein
MDNFTKYRSKVVFQDGKNQHRINSKNVQKVKSYFFQTKKNDFKKLRKIF